MEARLVAIKQLANWLAYSWRVGGENKTVAFGKEPAVIDQPTYGRALLLEAAAESARNHLRSAHGDIVAEDARCAQAVSRQSFAGLAKEDADKITQADTKATDKALELNFPDPKMKSLQITITRARALKHLCEELIDDDASQPPSRPSIYTEGLLGENNKQTLGDGANDLDDYVTELLRANKQLERDYDKHAKAQKWDSGPLKKAVASDAALIETADACVLYKCAYWNVE